MQGKRLAREIATWIPTVLLALQFTLAGIGKFLPDSGWAHAFRTYGYPVWFRLLIGVLEVSSAALLLLPRTAAYGALTAVVIMIGAIGTLAMNDALRGTPMALVALAFAVPVLLLRWRQRISISSRRPLVGQE